MARHVLLLFHETGIPPGQLLRISLWCSGRPEFLQAPDAADTDANARAGDFLKRHEPTLPGLAEPNPTQSRQHTIRRPQRRSHEPTSGLCRTTTPGASRLLTASQPRRKLLLDSRLLGLRQHRLLLGARRVGNRALGGCLWTPPYWDFDNGRYRFHHGYWASRVGFYGGVDYGFGYPGSGYYGGHWDNGKFADNVATTNARRRTTPITPSCRGKRPIMRLRV